MQKPRPARGKQKGWVARYVVTEGGRRVERSAGVYLKQRDAQDAINRALNEHAQGRWVDPQDSRTLVSKWAEDWYALRKAPSRKVRSVLDSQVIPRWGDWQLGDVKAMHVQQWVNEMAQTMAPSSVRDYYGIFRRMMERAVQYEMIAKNPCIVGVDGMPTAKEGEYVFLTVEETRVLEAVAPPRFRAMIHLAVWTGMRIGEIMALRWENVDLEGRSILICEAVKTNRAGEVIGLPKNGKVRRIRIAPSVVDALRAHRRDFGSADLVFTTTRQSKRLSYSNFRAHVWEPMMDEAGLEVRPTFHDLRHTYASLMIAKGMDIVVLSKLMGHHKPSFTLDRYVKQRHDADAHIDAILASYADTDATVQA